MRTFSLKIAIAAAIISFLLPMSNLSAGGKIPVPVWTTIQMHINTIGFDSVSHNILISQDPNIYYNKGTNFLMKMLVYNPETDTYSPILLNTQGCLNLMNNNSYGAAFLDNNSSRAYYSNPLDSNSLQRLFDFSWYDLRTGKYGYTTIPAISNDNSRAIFRHAGEICVLPATEADQPIYYYKMNGGDTVRIKDPNKLITKSNITMGYTALTSDSRYLLICNGTRTLYCYDLDSNCVYSVLKNLKVKGTFYDLSDYQNVTLTLYEKDHRVSINHREGAWDYINNVWDSTYTPVAKNEGVKVDVLPNGDSCIYKSGETKIYRVPFIDGKAVDSLRSVIYEEPNTTVNDTSFRFSNDYLLTIKRDTSLYNFTRNDSSVTAVINHYNCRFYDIRTGNIVNSLILTDSTNTPDPKYPSKKKVVACRNYGGGKALFMLQFAGKDYFTKGDTYDAGFKTFLYDVKSGKASDTLIVNYYKTDSLSLDEISKDGRIIAFAANQNFADHTSDEFRNTKYYRTLTGKMIAGKTYTPDSSAAARNNSYHWGNFIQQFYPIGSGQYVIRFLDEYYCRTEYGSSSVSNDNYFLISDDSVYSTFPNKNIISSLCHLNPSGSLLINHIGTNIYSDNYVVYKLHNGLRDSAEKFVKFSIPYCLYTSTPELEFISDSTVIIFKNIVVNIADSSNVFGYEYWLGSCRPIDDEYTIGEKNIVYRWEDTTTTSVAESFRKDASKCFFSIYPTPAGGFLNVKAEVQQPTEMLKGRIINMRGETVKTISSATPEFEINTSELPSGAYIISLENPELQRSEFRIFNILK